MIDCMTRDELLERLAGILRRRRQSGQVRVPQNLPPPFWLFGQFAATGSSQAGDQQAEGPVGQMINEFGPPVALRGRGAAAMPFVHPEREL